MSIFELLITAVALSMDAMAVSIASGLTAKKVRIRSAVFMALAFGVFQALMPAIGFYIIPLLSRIFGSGVESFVKSVDHWIAFILLAFIGGKMIVEAIKNEEEDVRNDPFRPGSVLVLAVATSIDALATGIVFSSFGFTTGRLVFSVLLIGAITFALSLFGVLAGKKLGERFKRWAVLAGGIALALIGLKILIEHLIG
ncbi:MAG: manganese efflux pump [Clostridia bacterium]|nr:manganese efflux pump [Clostridia bacterium]